MQYKILFFFALISLSAVLCQADDGVIRGRISPEGVPVRIIAKPVWSNADKIENRKGELFLPEGGDWTMTGLPPGTYTLIFELTPESGKLFIPTPWSNIKVGPGVETPRINHRLTPRDSPHLIDEVVIGFRPSDENAVKNFITSVGCVVKEETLRFPNSAFIVADIPDDKTVEEMIDRLKQSDLISSAEPNGIGRFDEPSSHK